MTYKDRDEGECVVLLVCYGGLTNLQKSSKIPVYRKASNAGNIGILDRCTSWKWIQARKTRFRTDLGRYWFTNRVVNDRNRLRRHVVSDKSIAIY